MVKLQFFSILSHRTRHDHSCSELRRSHQHTRQSQQAQVTASYSRKVAEKAVKKLSKGCQKLQKQTSDVTKNEKWRLCSLLVLQIVILVSHWEYTIGVHRNTLHYAVLDARFIQKWKFYLGGMIDPSSKLLFELQWNRNIERGTLWYPIKWVDVDISKVACSLILLTYMMCKLYESH